VPAPLRVGDIFRNAARAVPDRVAVVVGDDAITFGRLDRMANAAAQELAGALLHPGDRIAVLAPTDLTTVVLFAAVAKFGGVFVPLNPALGDDELAAIVAAARPAAVIQTDVSDTSPFRRGIATWGRDRHGWLDEAARDIEFDHAVAETDPHVVFFTSGSTGAPKGAVLSHRVNVLRTHPGSQFEPRGVNVCMFPLFHMAGWTIAMGQWQARDAVVFAPPEPDALVGAVERYRATRMNCIPLVWRRILDAVAAGAIDPAALSSLRFADTGTSATPPELLTAIRGLVPRATVRVFYGSTEAGNVASLEMADFDRKPGRVGPPSLLTRARLTGSGELEVAGPLLFDGYFEDPEATAAALVDGWYRTGDLAELDDDGHLTVTGRAHATIRTGGETVAPTEVEQVLRDHPAVADVAVVGLPDAGYGEVVCAVVVPRDAHAPTLADLRAHASGALAGYKLPRRLAVVDEIPRTAATGQVQRHLVVERISGV
jgi:acyl-CoA synthetase (AMP-forming)/AMP-acid ligase II